MLLWLCKNQNKAIYGGSVLLSDPNSESPMLADSYEPYGYVYVSY